MTETEIFDLEITDLSRGGAGVGRDASGRAIFVPFTAPGDKIKVRITEVEKRYAQGEWVEIIEPSTLRVTPRCPAFTRCGGCQWQHLPYSYQWKTKLSGVLHALSRVQVTPERPIEELPAERIWEYRNRIQLRGEHRPEGTVLGFYASGSHDIVPLDRCDIARPEINAQWKSTRTESQHLSRPFKVELETTGHGEVNKSWNRGHAALGFRQVHDEQNLKLRSWVRSALTPGLALLDLFGGSGNLSFQFCESSPEIRCVDLSVPHSKPEIFPAHFHFHRSPVTTWLANWKPEKQIPRSAILDPPRVGLGPDFHPIVEKLEKIGVTELLAVGCDPDAWARDISRYLKRGWKLDRVAVLDLFPQTPHVESLARFVRNN